jgi:acyl-CoA synthetase (AMP-forming)/AMP-acid ligase II
VNIFSILDQTATRLPGYGAVYLGTKQLLTFAELRSRALRIARSLRLKYDVGTRIGLVSDNTPEYVELLFGIWAAEMIATPINAKLHPAEMVQIIEDATVSATFVSPKLAAAFGHALETSRHHCDHITIGGTEYSLLLGEEREDVPLTAPDALAWLFYTSGTTGRSKGAMLSHRNLLAMTLAHLADLEAVDENTSLLHAAPMSHGSGLYILPYIAHGARQVLPQSSGFNPAEFLALCEHHPGIGAFLAPTMVQRLRLEAEQSGRRPANLRTIIYGGGPMYVEELKKSLATFGQVFVQIYGQGESPVTITGLRRADHETDDERILGSVGYARGGVEVRVVTAEDAPLPPGEIGEIVCRGDVVMSGYWNNPPATAETLKNGWLYTGDIGSFDERGYLTLRDRSKDVVITGGSNVYPREVEETLLRHPAVAEVCVLGQPDPEWGEIVVAFIVRVPGSDVSEAALDQLCNDNIARFKRPKRYVFSDALPKNSYGKVFKRELRDWLSRMNTSGT